MNDNREKPKDGSALMFSGGMDSYLAYRLFKPKHLVFCAAGHKYQEREREAIRQVGLEHAVVEDHTLDLRAWERGDAIIPLRNMLFACVGSRYADEVWLGSLAGEVNWDKTHEFYWTASTAISHCYRESYWCEGRTVAVSSPTAKFTKAELLGAALAAGVTKAEVGRTVSCYHPDGFCGACSSCGKRAIATKLNGWVEDYRQDPFKSTVVLAMVVKAMQGQYQPRRSNEILDACGHPKDVAEAIDNLKGAPRRG